MPSDGPTVTVWHGWIGVHRWRLAGVLLLLSGIAAGQTRTLAIPRVGVQSRFSPVPLALLIPVLSATAVAIDCVGPSCTCRTHPGRRSPAWSGW